MFPGFPGCGAAGEIFACRIKDIKRQPPKFSSAAGVRIFSAGYEWSSKLEVVLLLVIEVDDKSTHYCNSNEQSKLIPIT